MRRLCSWDRQPSEIESEKQEFGCRETAAGCGVGGQMCKGFVDRHDGRQGRNNGGGCDTNGKDIELTSTHVHHESIHQDLLAGKDMKRGW